MSAELPYSENRRNNWLFWVLAAAILATAFAVRWHVYKVWDYVGSADQGAYLWMAREIAAGRPLTGTYHTPGFPAIIAVVMRIGVSPERSGQVATLILGVAAVGLVGLLGRRLYGQRAALAAMSIAAVHPDLVWRATNGMSESSYCFALLAAILLLTSVNEERAWAGRRMLSGVGGLVLGFLYLTRPEGIAAAVLMALALAIGPRAQRREGLLRGATALAGVLVVVLPYVVWLHAHTGKWQLSGKMEATMGWDERGEEGAIDPLSASPEVAHERFASPRAILRRFPLALLKYARRAPSEFDGPAMFALAALALFAAPWDWRRMHSESLMIAPWGTLLVASAFYYNSRFFMPLLPIVVVWAGQGAVHIGSWWQESFSGGRRAAAVASLVALGLAVVPNTPDLARLARRSEVPLEEKPAAQWLEDHVPANTRLINGKTMVPFYADLKADPAPHAPPETVYAAALQAGDEYLIVGERQDAKWWPTLMPFTNDKAPPAGFALVYQSPEKPRVMIYRVLPPIAP